MSADRRPLRQARAPVRVGVERERLGRRLDVVVAELAHQLQELRILPQRRPIGPGALVRAGEGVGGRDLGLAGAGPLCEEPRRLLLLLAERTVDREAPVPDGGDPLAGRTLGPPREADLADHLGLLRVGHHRGAAVRVDVRAEDALSEGVRNVRPVPILHSGRRVRIEQLDVVLQRGQRFGRVHHHPLAVEPFASEGAEDRRVDVHVLPRPPEPAQRAAPEAIVGIVDGLRVRGILVEGLGGCDALRVVDVLAVDLDGGLAIERDRVRASVDGGGAAVTGLDVLEHEPRVVGQPGVAEVIVDGVDPAVGDIEHVIHGVGGVGRPRAGLAGEIEHRLLADLAGRRHLQARFHAGQRLEVFQYRFQVLEVTRGNHADRDLLALRHAPVDVRARERLEVHMLPGGVCFADEQAGGGQRDGAGDRRLQDRPARNGARACS